MTRLNEKDLLILRTIPVGSGERITSNQICKRIDEPFPSKIRTSINKLRANFYPICSDGKGYFMADKPEDINHTIASLNSRIHKMIQAREGIKKMQKVMEAQAHNE